ncbi:MAG: bifunctional methylenetetrahydrofolate dehydrogenase/methenyltetrahydrofolate cyclohydrolase FolD [Kofleriaceae bacterium]
MTRQLLDGKALAARVRGEVRERALALAGRPPALAVVLVGDDPASAVYVRAKHKAAVDAGVTPHDHKLPASTTSAELLALIDRLNRDDEIDGILVQLPLPAHLDSAQVIRAIDPAKDVDGLHPQNLGLLAQGEPSVVPCTPKGCMRLLQEAGATLRGARAVVVGRSVLVGRPVALLLAAADATVTLCHSRTADLSAELRRAAIVIAAAGRPGLVRGEDLAPGSIVIDVGINRRADGSLVGDVAFDETAHVGAITPVPGGVGPMTIACLMENTVLVAQRRR